MKNIRLAVIATAFALMAGISIALLQPAHSYAAPTDPADSGSVPTTNTSGGTCQQKSFLLLPPWYKYLVESGRMEVSSITGRCDFKGDFQIQDIGLIALAILDIMLRIAGIIATGFVIYGGILLLLSQGEPDQSKKARQTIINAFIGVLIALIATGFVSFIGSRLTS